MTMTHPATIRKPHEGRRIGIVGDVYRFLATGEDIGEGTFLNMPVGSLHCFKNESDKTARLLISVAPAGLEKMFFEVGSRSPTTQRPHRRHRETTRSCASLRRRDQSAARMTSGNCRTASGRGAER